jgi:aspartyl aminopeptidase
VCVLTDKEEIGSEGTTGMQSAAFENFMSGLCGGLSAVGRTFSKSFCISADVCNAYDPNFPDVSEKNNSAYINCGIAVMKYTGARGKSGSNDASAETMGAVRRLFDQNSVVWQTTELGKVDQGGGGTVAMYMANRNIETVDAGVPVLSMHAPYEIVSKLDCYMTYKGIRALYES